MRTISELPKKWILEANPGNEELGSLPVDTMRTLYPEFFYYGSNPKRAYDVINVLLTTTVVASPQLMNQKFIDDWKPLHSAIDKYFYDYNSLVKNLGALRYPKAVEKSVAEKMLWLIDVGMEAVPAHGVAGLRMFCYYTFIRDALMKMDIPPSEETDITLFIYLTLVDPDLGKVFLPAEKVDELNTKFDELKERHQSDDYKEARSKMTEHQMWGFILNNF